MKTTWNIQPHIGVGPLKFGMTPEEVAKIMGPIAKGNIKEAYAFPIDKSDPKAVQEAQKALNKEFENSFCEIRMDDKGKNLPFVTYTYGKVTSVEVWNKQVIALHGNKLALAKNKRKELIEHLWSLDQDAWIDFESVTFKNLGVNLPRPHCVGAYANSINVFEKGNADLILIITEAEPFKSMADL